MLKGWKPGKNKWEHIIYNSILERQVDVSAKNPDHVDPAMQQEILTSLRGFRKLNKFRKAMG